MSILAVLIQLAAGAGASCIMKSAFPSLRCGAVDKLLLGMIGGVVGGSVCIKLYEEPADMEIFLCSIAGGAVGGLIFTGLLAWMKKIFK